MPELTIRNEINTDEDTYWTKCVFNNSFNEALYTEGLKFPVWKVIESHEDDTKITRRVQVDPPLVNVPAAVKKVLGDRFGYVEEGTFDKKAKRYKFKVTPTTMAGKTTVNGEMWVEKVSDKKITRLTKISVEVKIFMVGNLVEERIMSDLRTSYEKGTTFTNDFLASQGL